MALVPGLDVCSPFFTGALRWLYEGCAPAACSTLAPWDLDGLAAANNPGTSRAVPATVEGDDLQVPRWRWTGGEVNPQRAETFFALLTVVALAVVAAVVGARTLASRMHTARAVLDTVRSSALGLAAAVAVTAMAGSLYFSESAGFVPCTLCWYQRIAMYSLAVILTIAAITGDAAVVRYARSLAGVGAVIAMYHWLLERVPDLDAGVCSSQVLCDLVWFEKAGFITLAFMALTGFVTVLALLAVISRSTPDKESS